MNEDYFVDADSYIRGSTGLQQSYEKETDKHDHSIMLGRREAFSDTVTHYITSCHSMLPTETEEKKKVSTDRVCLEAGYGVPST